MVAPFVRHGQAADSWWGTSLPITGPVGSGFVWLGEKIVFTVPGRVAGFRMYNDNGAPNTPFLFLLGELVGSILLPRMTGSLVIPTIVTKRWHQVWKRPWHRVTQGGIYWVMVTVPTNGQYRTTNALAAGPVVHNGIRFFAGFTSSSLNIFAANPTENSNANGIDVLFYPD